MLNWSWNNLHLLEGIAISQIIAKTSSIAMSMSRLFKSTLIKIVELWCKSYGWWCQHYSPDDAVAHLQIVHPLLSLAYPLWQFNEQNIGYREHNRNPSQTPRINNNNDSKLTLPAMMIYIERRRRWLSHGRFCK